MDFQGVKPSEAVAVNIHVAFGALGITAATQVKRHRGTEKLDQDRFYTKRATHIISRSACPLFYSAECVMGRYPAQR